MGETAVKLDEREFERIGEFVKSHLEEWMGEVNRARELDVLERVVRVEEELKSLRALMNERFDMMEKRFEMVDKRFESVDKRFETMQAYMDKRFESVDKRFETMQAYMDKRFSSLQWTMGIGFTVIAALMGVFNFF